ncbi:MAG: hypothetical protein L0229_01795 [Blastocatellia bacterium]|nr:hypothetical protein [Blastocatellia bacterium]
MKKLSFVLAVVLLAATSVAAQQNPCNPCAKKAQNPCNPCSKKAQNPCNPCSAKAVKVKGGNQTIVGYIGDSQCGLEHPMNMGDAKACTLKCIEAGGKFILADRENKVVYAIDKGSQEKVREFAGQQVKVTGNVNAKSKTIKISKIEVES